MHNYFACVVANYNFVLLRGKRLISVLLDVELIQQDSVKKLFLKFASKFSPQILKKTWSLPETRLVQVICMNISSYWLN